MVPQAEQYSVSPGKSKPEMRVPLVPATISAVQTGRVPPVPADQIKDPRGAAERTAAEQEFVSHRTGFLEDNVLRHGKPVRRPCVKLPSINSAGKHSERPEIYGGTTPFRSEVRIRVDSDAGRRNCRRMPAHRKGNRGRAGCSPRTDRVAEPGTTPKGNTFLRCSSTNPSRKRSSSEIATPEEKSVSPAPAFRPHCATLRFPPEWRLKIFISAISFFIADNRTPY